MKPYPTYAEVITAMGRSGRSVEFMQALIEKACDIDRKRRDPEPAAINTPAPIPMTGRYDGSSEHREAAEDENGDIFAYSWTPPSPAPGRIV